MFVILKILLIKDLRRWRDNPIPWLIQLIIPLMITAIMGIAFSGGSENAAHVRFAIVDEDNTTLQQLLPSLIAQDKAGKVLDPVFLTREDALSQIRLNKISGIVILPKGFSERYLASDIVRIELIKNPAESIHPIILEEMLKMIVTVLNVTSQKFSSELAHLGETRENNTSRDADASIMDLVKQVEETKGLFYSPIITYVKEAPTGSIEKPMSEKSSSDLLPNLLIGMTSMFLLILGGNAMGDVHRELRDRTFERYYTMRQSLMPFITSKIVYAVVMLLFSSAVMLGGGGLIFGIRWHQPFAMVTLTITYTICVAALFAVLVALESDARRSGVLNNIVAMALSIMSGAMFSTTFQPAFIRDNISPLLPSYDFVFMMRSLEHDAVIGQTWSFVALELVGWSLLLITISAIIFHRRFKNGLTA